MNYELLLGKVKNYVGGFFESHDISKLTYHNLSHTEAVVKHTTELAKHYKLDEPDLFIVNTAAWFHDTGYYTGAAQGHEQRGADLASEFLKKDGVSETVIDKVQACILSTVIPQSPKTLNEQIVCDADLYHFGTVDFSDRNKLMRKEFEERSGKKMDKDKWRTSTIRLLETHHFHTDYCQQLLNEKKQQNLLKLKSKEKIDTPNVISKTSDSDSGDVTSKKKTDRPEKGIETMFRISSTNHQRLSDMADNKANIMISTTSIIISVILSVLIRRLEDNVYLTIPTMLLLTICVVTMVFSILATRPNIPNGMFRREDVDQNNVNLLFFGNFYRMSFKDYSYGMNKMMEDRDFLYGSLTKDIYAQGVVLGKKYRLLRVSYNVFMFGIIASVVSFIIASAFYGSVN